MTPSLDGHSNVCCGLAALAVALISVWQGRDEAEVTVKALPGALISMWQSRDEARVTVKATFWSKHNTAIDQGRMEVACKHRASGSLRAGADKLTSAAAVDGTPAADASAGSLLTAVSAAAVAAAHAARDGLPPGPSTGQQRSTSACGRATPCELGNLRQFPRLCATLVWW